jgi:acyl-CoA thioesterase-1
MRVARLGTVLLVVLAVLLGTAALGSAAQAAATITVLSVGDSVPSGVACSCSPYPVGYARSVAAHTATPSRAANYAFSGATSADTLSQVRAWGAGGNVGAASVAVLMVGANDFGPAFRRVLHHQQRALHAFPPVAATVRADVIAAVRRLQQLHPGLRVVVMDYWNVMKDGAVGRRAYGEWGMAKAAQATVYANTALHQAASATGATFVSSRLALKGPTGKADPTRFLAADGDHPNAAGHAAIAAAIARVLPRG